MTLVIFQWQACTSSKPGRPVWRCFVGFRSETKQHARQRHADIIDDVTDTLSQVVDEKTETKLGIASERYGWLRLFVVVNRTLERVLLKVVDTGSILSRLKPDFCRNSARRYLFQRNNANSGTFTES